MRLEDYSVNQHNHSTLPDDIAWKKKSGWIGLNGNVRSEWDMVWFLKEVIDRPKHKWDYQNNSKKTLLVTAGFDGNSEYDDGHLRQHYNKVGVDWHNIDNLGVTTEYRNFIHGHEGYLAKNYKDFYGWMISRDDLNRPNADLLYRIHKFLGEVRYQFPAIELYDLYHACVDNLEGKIETIWNHVDIHTKFQRVEQTLEFARKYPDKKYTIKNLFDDLKRYDRWFFDTWRHETEKFFNDGGFYQKGHWNHIRNILSEKIRSAASIFMWGGSWINMLNALKFFRLDHVMHEAKANGTNYYGMSAGTIVMMDNIYDLGQRSSASGFIRPYMSGLGLIKGMTIYTHVQDFKFINENGVDEKSTIALRTDDPAIGLTTNSIALVDEDTIYSVGGDPVYCFEDRGWTYYLESGSNIR